MHLAVFSSADAAGFAPDWRSEAVAVVFGSARLDLTERPPADGATLDVRALFGSVEVIVPAGRNLTVSGLCLFGSRCVQARPGSGPELHIRAGAVFGSVDVVEKPHEAAPLPARDAAARFFRGEVGIRVAGAGVQAG